MLHVPYIKSQLLILAEFCRGSLRNDDGEVNNLDAVI